jgi:hypothetical protein
VTEVQEEYTLAIWKEVKGYEGLYLVSDDGRVYALPRTIETSYRTVNRSGKLLKPGKRGKGRTLYEFVVLSDGEQSKHHAVHRLVATAFLDNPDNLPEVNHIDENPLNNHASNLEWCDRQYNIEYSKNKPVAQYDTDGMKIAEYKSIKYAASLTGISRTSIGNVLNGWSMTAGGYVWKYSK